MKRISLSLICLLVIWSGCSHKKATDVAKVEVEAPKVQKVMLTTYADVKGIFEAKCAPCHFPMQGGNKATLDNYVSAKNLATEIIRRVELTPTTRGFMPFRKTEALPAEDIALLKKWVADGMTEK